MYCAHDVCGVRLNGVAVTRTDQGLCGKVKHVLGLDCADNALQRVRVADVPDVRVHIVSESKPLVKIRRSRRRQRKTSDFGARLNEDRAKPRAFEARVPGNQNATALPSAQV